ncbi:hypothetical protein OSB04_019738 [Centaurea solstitialis]|uniref:Integrase catalytic domain-containing protein n=1 Tax=Centaurea solstitialis TaxID=347529 RepID=A0AA38T350_9ASTR|nr:hypothetical protein OSB04_019738 [Centaurea solstitialis]
MIRFGNLQKQQKQLLFLSKNYQNTSSDTNLLHSDRGDEYLSLEFNEYLKECGIVSQFSSPRTPQLNGVDERHKRTLLDIVRSMMTLAPLSIYLLGICLRDSRPYPKSCTNKEARRGVFRERELIAKEVSASNIDFEEIQESNDEIPDVGTSTQPKLNYKEAMEGPEAAKWKEAMDNKIQSMYDNQVWTLVDQTPDRKTIGHKWIFKKKTDMEGNVHTFKARLVAKGYTQTQWVNYDETFSLVAMIKSIRIMLAIAAFYDYEEWQMDVKIAFLYRKLLEDMYMTQSEGFLDIKHPNRVCKLEKSIYRLKQASRFVSMKRSKAFGFSMLGSKF